METRWNLRTLAMGTIVVKIRRSRDESDLTGFELGDHSFRFP